MKLMRIRWESLMVVVGFVIMGLWGFVIWQFFPSYQMVLSSQETGFFIGFIFLMVAAFFAGVSAIFRADSPQLITPNDILPQGTHGFLDVPDRMGVIDISAVRDLTPVKDNEELDKAMKVIPGTNAPGGPAVPRQVLPLGGIDAHGFHLGGGKAGFMVTYGRDQVIQLGEKERGQMWFVPRVLEYRDHTGVESEVLDVLLDHPSFVPGKSPILVAGRICDPVREWLKSDPEVREIVTGSPVPGSEGFATAEYWRSMYFAALTELNNLNSGKVSYLNWIRELEKHGAARAQKLAKMYRRPSLGPSYDIAESRPRDEVEP